MKIIKSFPQQDAITDVASRLFDEAIKRVEFPWRFERMEFHVRDENKIVLTEEKCTIVIDYNDLCVQSRDVKGVAAMILQSLFKAAAYQLHGKLPDFILEVAANREMIRSGYGEYLSYYYFQNFGRRDGLYKYLPWISFYSQEKYYAEMFLEICGNPGNNQPAAKLFELLKKDASTDALEHASRLYIELQEKGLA